MVKRPHSSPSTADLVLHLSRLAQADRLRSPPGRGKDCDLTPAQWATLRYFAKANRFSRTACAFADFHATTRGTASQTIKSLVAGGFLKRTPSHLDGRSALLDLTDKAWAMLNEDPYQALVEAIEGLPPATAAAFTTILKRLTHQVSSERGAATFGECDRCEHFDPAIRSGESVCRYFCQRAGEALAADELDRLCVDFEPVRSRRLGNVPRAACHE
jgi:DNA-binding MarR family transcriptional regulator